MNIKLVASFYLLVGLFLLTGCGTGTAQPATDIDVVETEENVTEEQQEEVESITVDEQPEEIENDLKEDVVKIDTSLSKMSVHYIDVGQAEATLIEFNHDNEEYAILIDTGNWNASDVVTYLQSNNIQDIDIVAVTHPHADHIGQLDKVINSFNVDEVWMNGETANSQVFSNALAAIENSGVGYYEPEVGDVFDIGPLVVSVLHPISTSGSTNNNSTALHLQYGEISFLFTGDAEQQAESDMLGRNAKLKADILHVAHHGSNTSNGSKFLSAVQPQIAIYSAGSGNQYGHPHIETIDRIEASGALLYGTDVHGTVMVETDGKTFSVHTHKQGTIPRQAVVNPPPVPETKKEILPPSGGSCVDINTASEVEVQSIIHIGPARSMELVSQRPYDSVDNLTKIKGLGPARIKDIITQGIACIGG